MLPVPVRWYSRARALHFLAQKQLLNWVGGVAFPESQPGKPTREEALALRDAALEMLDRDARNIEEGIYPPSVLVPESPLRHWRRFPKVLMDSLKIGRRRDQGRTTEFEPETRELLEELPQYYRRCFHFQTEGYLSRASAEVYEHQVEILFAGTADAMRRMAIPPLRKHLRNSKGLRILEVAAGTCRSSRFLSDALPKARIVATDLSQAYLKVGQERLANYPRIDFMQADATRLPFKDGEFDAVYSVFLFHELPAAEREKVLGEMHRVVKPGGVAVMVDSLQLGDVPGMDIHLERFPEQFHEPFYRNYISRPMEDLFRKAGFNKVESEAGFLSKVISAVRM